ncbi:GEVED domain-containing protein [uncultured Duncaniella sp.]|uniref:GEVED domain-containing protein n=1 Tax=uncultured Duncaniella sp. TaxID=2768039 RepID=UPI0026478399|nr:GEVED domain-containing protein [uncultured Duncaniella sp.]
MKIRNAILLASMAFAPVMSAAITTPVKVTFETEDYKSIGVYDTWEASPFRTGQLKGNACVTSNPEVCEENPSEKVLGVQRSRYGSNTFGVRIDLEEPFDLTTDMQYVHVLINTPMEGRVMLVGLGKRRDRAEQSTDVEQFWVFPINSVTPNEWTDAVFPVNGAGGIDIYSLVVVPYAESSHEMIVDFPAYVDDIELMTTSVPRVGLGDYPINFDKDYVNTRYSERHIRSVSLAGETVETSGTTLYQSLIDKSFKVKAGESVLPVINYLGIWMHGYVYLDVDNDGQFSYELDGRVPADGSDLMAYSYYNGYNHLGYSASNQSWTMRNFTIPSDLANGMYRMRFKIDWDSVDPSGCIDPSNSIINNAGGIVDIMLNVHGDVVTVTQGNLNGEVLAADGSKLNNYKAPFGEDFKIKMVPAPGFEYEGVRVRHGYNLDGPATVHSNPQYREELYTYDQFGSDDTFTIPGEVMDGDVLIEGLFVETGALPGRVNVTYNLKYNDKVLDTKKYVVSEGDPYPAHGFNCETSGEYYSIENPDGNVGDSDEEIDLELTHSLPFVASDDLRTAMWYTLTITKDGIYLHNNGSLSYMTLSSSSNSYTDEDEIRWCFVGNAYEGFKIYNRKAGEGKILSSSTNTSANTGGSTYVVLANEPVAEGNNTYWIPTSSTFRTPNGFCLHQAGFSDNKLNSRDNRLAYWTGGYDAGSTLLATLSLDETTGIDFIGEDCEDNSVMEYYNLQGMRVNEDRLIPGVYILKTGSKTQKILVK